MDCDQTCYKKDGDFGAFVLPVHDTEDVEYLCRECNEIENSTSERDPYDYLDKML